MSKAESNRASERILSPPALSQYPLIRLKRQCPDGFGTENPVGLMREFVSRYETVNLGYNQVYRSFESNSYQHLMDLVKASNCYTDSIPFRYRDGRYSVGATCNEPIEKRVLVGKQFVGQILFDQNSKKISETHTDKANMPLSVRCYFRSSNGDILWSVLQTKENDMWDYLIYDHSVPDFNGNYISRQLKQHVPADQCNAAFSKIIELEQKKKQNSQQLAEVKESLDLPNKISKTLGQLGLFEPYGAQEAVNFVSNRKQKTQEASQLQSDLDRLQAEQNQILSSRAAQ